ncbi:histidine kinase [Crocinitomicaceae bacterium]|nr:histidine kinase [Crocinitomicaceae bacterium]
MTQKLMHTSLWVFLLSLFHFSNLLSQIKDPQPQFIHYGIEQGLPSSETYYVYQDKKGYMWFCTDRGVVRFDGYRYKTYTTKDGLSSNVVFKVYEDFKGRIWFLSMSNELCYLEGEKIKSYKYNNLINKYFGKTSQSSKDIYIDKQSNLNITIKFYGTIKIDNKGKLDVLDELKGNKIAFLQIDSAILNSQVYTKPSVLKIVPITLCFNKKTINSEWDKQETFGLYFKKSFFYFLNGEIHNSNALKVSNFNENNRVLFIKKNKNKIYIGTLNNGVKIVEFINNEFKETNKYFPHLSITSIFIDVECNTWVSTLENGIFKIKNESILNLNKNNGLLENYVNSISGFSNNVYVGFNSGKWQNLYNKKEFNNLVETRNKTKLTCFNSTVFISTNHLYQLKEGKLTKILLGQWIRTMNVNSKELLITTTNVTSINKKNDLSILYIPFFDNTKNKESKFEALLRNENGTILLGNENGLHKLENRKINHNSLDNPLFKARIIDLQYSSTFNNIAATRGKGIYFFKDSIIIDSIRTEDGLLSNDINSLYVDSKDRLWVCSNKGLNLINKLKGKYNIEQFTTKNGLISNEINEVYEYNNKVWCATKKGVSIIDLSSFKRSYIKYPLYLEKVVLKNKTYTSFIKRTFAYDEEFVKILFRSTNYKNSRSPKYAYRTSKKAKWQYINIPEIVFNQPSSNEYHIEVKSLNEDGRWSKPQLLYSFKIDLPFYYKWYTISFGVIIIVLLMFSIFKYRLYQINQKNNLQKQIKKLESKALRAQMNPHFIFNALNSIQSFLVYEENEKAEKYLVKFAYLIRQTLNNSRKTVISIEDETNILNRYLELEQMRFKDKFTFKIYNNIKEKDLHLKIPPMMIQPYVENAILHAFKKVELGGVINITFAPLVRNKLTCTIEDNGIGINNSLNENKSNHQSLGTTITQERLSFFSKKKTEHFNILSKQGSQWGEEVGTTIIIEIPIFKSDEEF